MWIEMKTLMAGPGGVREAGRVYEVPDKEAKALIEGGYAKQVEAPRRRPVEQAVAPHRRRGSRAETAVAVSEGDE